MLKAAKTEVIISPVLSQTPPGIVENQTGPYFFQILGRKFRFDPFVITLCLLFGVGLYLRLDGLQIGLPYVVPADESLVVDSATHLLKAGNFDPASYYYPGLLHNLEAIVFLFCFVWGTLTGRYHSLADLPDKTYFITTAPDFYLWGRAFAAIAGALTILLVFWLVQQLWQDKLAAIFAAGFVACSAMLIENSHYITNDMPMTALDVLVLYPAWKLMQTGQRRYYVGAGIIIGLAAATKYNGALAIVTLLAAHLCWLGSSATPGQFPILVAFKRFINANLLLSVLSAVGAFLVVTPYFLADLRGYTDGFVSNYTKYLLADPATSPEASNNPWLTYLAAFWHDSPLVMLLAGGGLLWLALRHTRLDILLLVFPLVYLVSLNGLPLVYTRNGIVVLLFCQLWAALFGSWLVRHAWASWQKRASWRLTLPHRTRTILSVPLLLGVLGLTMFGSLRDSLYGNYYNNRDITYVVAQHWLEKQAGPGALKLVEMRPQQWADYPNTLPVGDNNDTRGADEHTLEYYQERGIAYLAINDARAQTARTANQGNYPTIFGQSQLATHILGRGDERLGPDFSILQTGVTPQTLKLQHPLPTDFGNELRLLGFNLGTVKTANQLYLPADPIQNNLPTFKAGQILGLSVYWQTLAAPTHDYIIFIHLVPLGQPDTKVAQRDTQPLQGVFPTSHWQVGQLVTDEPNLPLPSNLAPGQYQILLGLYQPDQAFTPLTLSDGQNVLTLATITIEK